MRIKLAENVNPKKVTTARRVPLRYSKPRELRTSYSTEEEQFYKDAEKKGLQYQERNSRQGKRFNLQDTLFQEKME